MKWLRKKLRSWFCHKKNNSIKLDQEQEKIDIYYAKKRITKIEKMLASHPPVEFPKAIRAIKFYEARPLMCYKTPRQQLFGFLKEIGIDIEKESDLGDMNEVKNWFLKAEALLPSGRTHFEEITRLIKP